MASLPYVTSPGNIAKAFSAIKAAPVPPKVNQDFVKSILKVPGGSGDQMTSYLKKIGFANSDATPTEIYTKFRNPTTSGISMAKAIQKGYAALYRRNEYMHELNDEELIGLIVEETGQASDSNPVKLTFSCIKALKEFADFSVPEEKPERVSGDTKAREAVSVDTSLPPSQSSSPTEFGLNLGYTINVNLPATTDQAVFNAIFKAIRDNLLRDEDA